MGAEGGGDIYVLGQACMAYWHTYVGAYNSSVRGGGGEGEGKGRETKL